MCASSEIRGAAASCVLCRNWTTCTTLDRSRVVIRCGNMSVRDASDSSPSPAEFSMGLRGRTTVFKGLTSVMRRLRRVSAKCANVHRCDCALVRSELPDWAIPHPHWRQKWTSRRANKKERCKSDWLIYSEKFEISSLKVYIRQAWWENQILDSIYPIVTRVCHQIIEHIRNHNQKQTIIKGASLVLSDLFSERICSRLADQTCLSCRDIQIYKNLNY